MGANARFTAADIPLERVCAAKVLYVGGYLLMPARLAEELAEVFRQARRWGVKTVLDIVLPGPGDHWAQLAPVLRETDLFLPNTDEAAAITGLADPRAQAERFREAGARHRRHHLRRRGNGVGLRGRAAARRHLSRQLRRGHRRGDAFDAGLYRRAAGRL